MEEKIIHLFKDLQNELEIYVKNFAIHSVGDTVKVLLENPNTRRYPLGHRLGVVEEVFADIIDNEVKILYKIKELKKDGKTLSKNLIYSGKVEQKQLLT